MSEQNSAEKKPVFLYIVIGVLTAALIAMGTLSFLCLNRLASLQGQVKDLTSTVEDIVSSSSLLVQQSKDLESLKIEESELSRTSGAATSTPESAEAEPMPESYEQEEGTLSPSTGNTFTDNTDSSMDNLLGQIESLLPQNNGTWSVYVCNLLKGSEGSIGNSPMQAASLIKLFIMGAVYENYGELSSRYGSESLDANLNSMITVSDNDAANTLTSWLGNGDAAAGMNVVNQFCQAHGYTDTSMGRLLLQSNENGDNYTSVNDCGKFLKEIYQICNGTASNPTLSGAESMYYLLKMQQRNNKIPAQLPEGVHAAHKTGELSNVENDAGILYDTAKGIDLVVCFMSQNLSDVGAAQSTIAQDTRMIYGYYNE